MNFIKPSRLNVGDTIAIISPSWGGPSLFPHVYESGIKVLEELGLKIKEFPTARMDDSKLKENPRLRADDINNAFLDKEIKAIFCSIGGDDSLRVLPYLNIEAIKLNPKIVMGYSDNTTLLTFCNQLGLVTFHGPTVMSGFAQANNLPIEFKTHIQDILFTSKDSYGYPIYKEYSEGYLDWDNVENSEKINTPLHTSGPKVIQGSGIVSGKLFGGCIEVIDFLKGTEFYPNISFFNEKIFFLETSEEKPSVETVRRILRNYGVQGVFGEIKALMFGRLRDYSETEKEEFYKTIKEVVIGEFDYKDLPIVVNMDFGHTDPQIILPLGVKASFDLDKNIFSLNENWTH